jgi:hypothetical protein
MCNCDDMDLEEVRRVKDEVEAGLLRRPGVTGVGVGYKVVGGRTTNTLAIKVYVKHKGDVPEGEAIPKIIRGVPTDVVERRFVLTGSQAEETEEDPAPEPASNRQTRDGEERRGKMKTAGEIRPIKEAREAELLKLPGVTGVGIGYKVVDGKVTDELAIRVYVAEKKELDAVPSTERVPKAYKGIKTDVIQRKFVLYPRMMAVAEMGLKADMATYDPLKGGMSLGPCRSVYLTAAEATCHNGGVPATAGYYIFVGTLGCVVIDNATKAEMLLSNFHVMCVDDGWHAGDTMCQPAKNDGGHCPADVVGSLQRAVLSNEVDAAIASHTARGYECSILEIGDVNGTATAAVGMAVRKRGRTTGLTYGNVTDTDLSVNINYCDGIGVHTLNHQIEIEVDHAQSAMFGTGGDSGSVVVNSGGRVVGLYFAGDDTGAVGIANPIASVLNALNVRMCSAKQWEIGHIKKQEADIKHHEIKKQEVDIKKQEADIKKLEKEQDIIGKGVNEPITGKGANEPIIGKGGNEPITPGPGVTPFAGQAGAQPMGSSLEERLARVEQALGQLMHFIQAEERPDLDRAPLQNEGDVGRQ